MRAIVTLLVFITAINVAAAQTGSDYTAALAEFRQYFNNNQPDSIINMMSGRAKKLQSPDMLRAQFLQMHTQLGKLISCSILKDEPTLKSFKADFDNGIFTLIVALSTDNKLDIFRLIKYEPETTLAPGQSTLELTTPSGNIYGLLSVPVAVKKFPVVLIIPGSGPIDIDGNAPPGIKGSIYAAISTELVKQGIGCARYDKRGVGKSTTALKDQEHLSFNDMINDASGLINLLKADPRCSEVIVLGHGEGALIGMAAASRGQVSRYISLSGAGERADQLLLRQFEAQSVPLAHKAAAIMDSIRTGYTATDIPPVFASIFNPTLQPYLRSWFHYDPAKEIRKLKIPTLILQGTTDLQANGTDAHKLAAAAPKATLKIINGMNQALKLAPGDRDGNLAASANAGISLHPELIKEIATFIQKKQPLQH